LTRIHCLRGRNFFFQLWACLALSARGLFSIPRKRPSWHHQSGREMTQKGLSLQGKPTFLGVQKGRRFKNGPRRADRGSVQLRLADRVSRWLAWSFLETGVGLRCLCREKRKWGGTHIFIGPLKRSTGSVTSFREGLPISQERGGSILRRREKIFPAEDPRELRYITLPMPRSQGESSYNRPDGLGFPMKKRVSSREKRECLKRIHRRLH